MTNQDINQARVWAESVGDIEGLHPEPRAAVEVILSLPDIIVDGDKLRQVIDFQGTSISEEARKDLESLLTPHLPTLAELIEQGDDPEKYVGMQCMVQGFPSTRVITKVRGSHVSVLREDLAIQHADTSKVTPLPDLPKLEWPAQEPRNSEEIVKAIRHEKELCLDSQDFSRARLWRDMERAAGQGEWKDLLNSIRELKLPNLGPITLTPPTREEEAEVRGQFEEPTLPLPEDVPPGEPWSVRYYGKEWAGVRADDDRAPWSIISMDGLDYRDVDDSEVTLMFPLVPGTP